MYYVLPICIYNRPTKHCMYVCMYAHCRHYIFTHVGITGVLQCVVDPSQEGQEDFSTHFCFDHVWSLVPQMLNCGSKVNLLGSCKEREGREGEGRGGAVTC